ncbi:MAG TPA: zinc ribbon domain-containing protein, partial [Thermomicrobiales bacterium]|nr:zinc ribbon domain-containing protein [Thermomicrobiales bacterium]
ILSILQLALTGFVFWQVYQVQSSFSSASPIESANSTFRTVGLIFIGIFAITALNYVYPLLAWGFGKLRQRQQTWTPEERFAIPTTEQPTSDDRLCPGCGASLFDDSPTCPWCGHQLA